MSSIQNLVLFSLDKKKYAINSLYYERAIRAVEITELPKVPANILGVINIHGEIVPVVNLRHILGLKAKELAIDDHMIIIKTEKKRLVLIADGVIGFVDNQILTEPDMLCKGIDLIEGVINFENEIIAITKIEKLYKEEELLEIQESIKGIQP